MSRLTTVAPTAATGPRRAGSHRTARRALIGATTGATLVAGVLASAPMAGAAVPAPAERSAGVVTADALPTAQIDGVAWSQAVAGNTVYVGGKFTTVRPAGAAAGQQTSPRSNLLAYSLSTGVATAFAPVANNQVYAVATSPDGTRVYVGGQFTSIDGTTRNRIAAFDTATGSLIAGFTPALNYTVKSLAVTNSTVYAGGAFATVGSAARNRVAAFDATTGALKTWDPNADGTVQAMTLTPDGKSVVLGGAFTHVGGTNQYGLAKVDATTGAVQSFPVNNVVRDAGNNAAITALTTDGTKIYGAGYVYGAGGNLEGAFAADPSSGALTWVEDCHGDTYGAYANGSALYVVGHSHFCGDVGGFPQTNPWGYQHALAFTPNVAGTLAHNPYSGYTDWYGTAAPAPITWYPDLAVGSYTGVGQAAWTITGTNNYLVLGGEFPSVNGIGQQGLVRFATTPTAPAKSGPQVTGANFTPTVTGKAGQATVTWTANWDKDNQGLTYSLYRDGNYATPVYQGTATSTFWNRPTLSTVDTTVTAGAHSYRLFVTDPDGNVVKGDGTNVTVAG